MVLHSNPFKVPWKRFASGVIKEYGDDTINSAACWKLHPDGLNLDLQVVEFIN